ncbi:hypothetical protein EVAR_30958_1 [Eumeta japonica]|uniref:Uncharacterized protein n=1 Tax=Eumeta variegata TaxID=151549 RepID=A0A4C1W6C2_EUMVA|nr:hypothetical protein EVAR_30958_1 [Eumeta japonica]
MSGGGGGTCVHASEETYALNSAPGRSAAQPLNAVKKLSIPSHNLLRSKGLPSTPAQYGWGLLTIVVANATTLLGTSIFTCFSRTHYLLLLAAMLLTTDPPLRCTDIQTDRHAYGHLYYIISRSSGARAPRIRSAKGPAEGC